MNRCGAINAAGARCFNRTKPGERCALHWDHERVTTQACSVVHRCVGRTFDGDPCFVRVGEPADLCRTHRRISERPPAPADPMRKACEWMDGLRREAERLNAQSEALLQTVEELRASR